MIFSFKKSIILFFPLLFLYACGTHHALNNKSQKETVISNKKEIKDLALEKSSSVASKILNEADKYLGTPYLFGGNTKKGIDCSGLIHNAYQSAGITLPRQSQLMSNEGETVNIKAVKKGDLLFFNTSGSGISHVGMVHKVVDEVIYFIHASSSKGVVVSSLEEKYWKQRFVMAKRML